MDTTGQLIETAIRLFAHHGYHGASVRRITREAGVNLGAITYHFGSKRELYERAFAACIGPLGDRIQGVAKAPGDPLTRLDEVLGLFMEYLEERPELPQLMLQETAMGRRPPPAAQEQLQRILGALAGIIAEGQAQGAMIRAGDPRLLAVSVVSQPLHLTLVTRAVDRGAPGSVDRSVLLTHAREFVRTGLGARGSSHRADPDFEGRR
ncbi:MAG TPA: TetR/AcrR family transcriptional regulator [Longimicrobiales bacterium]|nr:TetR/AcrR family transcriptional regulator [Longimicrobiales bacterium]